MEGIIGFFAGLWFGFFEFLGYLWWNMVAACILYSIYSTFWGGIHLIQSAF